MSKNPNLPEFAIIQQPSTKKFVLIRNGEQGYFEIPEMTENMVKSLNASFGITPAILRAMTVGSLFGWDVPGTDPKLYE